MNITPDKITEIYYVTDEFCKNFRSKIDAHSIGNAPKKKPIMSESEVITIMTLFHMSGYRTIKHFYIDYVQKYMTEEFPKTVSYNRFTELMQLAVLPMTMFLKMCLLVYIRSMLTPQMAHMLTP